MWHFILVLPSAGSQQTQQRRRSLTVFISKTFKRQKYFLFVRSRPRVFACGLSERHWTRPPKDYCCEYLYLLHVRDELKRSIREGKYLLFRYLYYSVLILVSQVSLTSDYLLMNSCGTIFILLYRYLMWNMNVIHLIIQGKKKV